MSRYVQPHRFGSGRFDLTPTSWNFLGRQGFWRVPLGWFCRQVDDNIWASPNFDFTNPTFRCFVNNDGYLVFDYPNGMPNFRANPVNRITFPVVSTNGVASYSSTVSPSEVWAFKDHGNGKIASVRIVNSQPTILEDNFSFPDPLNLISVTDTATNAPMYWRVTNGVAVLSSN